MPSTLTYTAAAQDQEQIDTLNLDLTWAEDDWIELECNSKKVRITAGPLTITPELMAAAVCEALLANHHSTASFTADMTVDHGGYEYGEFRDISCQSNGKNVTFISASKDTPFTLTVTSSTAGDGTSLHVAGVQSAIGKRHVNHSANYSGGSLPAAGDTVIVDDININLSYGWSNLPDGINWKFRSKHIGGAGLLKTNITHANYHYQEYRSRRAFVEPVAAGTLSITVEGSGDYFFDFGTNSTGGTNIIQRNGMMDIAGGDALEIIVTGGVASIGEDSQATVVNIKTIETLPGSTVTTGDNTTHVDAANNVIIRGGDVVLGSSPSGASSSLKAYAGALLCLETCSVNDIFDGGAYIDWRGAAINSLVGYAGTFDATLCEKTTVALPSELFAGYNYIDPNNIMQQPYDCNGCSPEQIKSKLARNVRVTLSAPGSVPIE